MERPWHDGIRAAVKIDTHRFWRGEQLEASGAAEKREPSEVANQLAHYSVFRERVRRIRRRHTTAGDFGLTI
jgi:hypothetical protein